MFKIDLHTHSSASPDGGIQPHEYEQLLKSKRLDFVAITDHNTIDLAKKMRELYGNKIIIGEEVDSVEGEIIGLFLKTLVAPGKSALETAADIKSQGGLVYVPHPFESFRRGLAEAALDNIKDLVDIVEVHNGRALFDNQGPKAATWARLHNKVAAASSDAHGHKGLFTTFTTVDKEPSVKNLVELLRFGHMTINRPPLASLLYPKYHRIRKKWSRT